jgi:hypothetical protein
MVQSMTTEPWTPAITTVAGTGTGTTMVTDNIINAWSGTTMVTDNIINAWSGITINPGIVTINAGSGITINPGIVTINAGTGIMGTGPIGMIGHQGPSGYIGPDEPNYDNRIKKSEITTYTVAKLKELCLDRHIKITKCKKKEDYINLLMPYIVDE